MLGKDKVLLEEVKVVGDQPILMIGYAKGTVTGKQTTLPKVTVQPGDSKYAGQMDHYRSIMRENESPGILSKYGHQVEQNSPPKTNGRKPDYRINGEYWDNYAPITNDPRGVDAWVKDKIKKEQADRFIINLADSNLTVSELYDQFNNYPVDRLKQIMVIDKNQKVYNVFERR